MIYLELLLAFLKIGCFAFGGAYAAIPLMREVVLSYGWMSDDMVAYMIAVSESTPGSVMVNLATYIGSEQGGVPGALIATLAVVTPAFVIILLLMVAFRHLLKNKWFQALLDGLKPCIIGIILATGVYMILNNAFGIHTAQTPGLRSILLTAVLLAVKLLLPVFSKKKISPIMLICISAVLGAVVFGL